MLKSYVCRQCTIRLSRRVVQVPNPQWQRRATFVTLRTRDTQDETEHTEVEPNSQSQSDASRNQTSNKPNIQYISQEVRPSVPPTRRYTQYMPNDADVGSWVPETYPVDVEYAKEADVDPGTGESFAQPIDEALQRRWTRHAWKLFEKAYTSNDCQALTDPPSRDLALLKDGKIFSDLLRTINIAFCNGHSNLAITPTAVLFRYEQLGLARPEYWTRRTIEFLTRRVILAVNCPNDKPQLNLPSLLFELLSVWRLFFQFKSGKVDSLTEIGADWCLPAIESLPKILEHKSFIQRLQTYHPKFRGDATLGFCAVYLYTISDALNSVEALEQQAAPLLQLLERLLAGSIVTGTLKFMEFSTAFQALPPEVQEQIRKEILDTPRSALAAIGEMGGIETEGTIETGDAAMNSEDFYLKRIARAIESRPSIGVLETLWNEIEKDYVQIQGVTLPTRIYNAFLAGFMALQGPQQSVQIWNHMIANGIKPDMQSWVALLDGCARSQDLNGFNGVWKRLLSTGLQPDNYAWTSRVNGLIAMRQINLGLAALDEMGKNWLSVEAVRTKEETGKKKKKGSKKLPKTSTVVNNCTKPSVEVVNSAISALMQIRRVALANNHRIEVVQKILGWARHFDIKPDVRTYNILVQLYLNAGETPTAFKVLKQMEKDDVQGDIATYTILVTAMFDHDRLSGLNEADQIKRVLSLFSSLEAAGVKLNDRLYAAAIDKFLKQYSNYSAVRVLIDHMTTRNMVPSAYIYTSLVTHYFQVTPPAITAVESLVTQLLSNHRMSIDRVLLDRVLEGYAKCGEVDKMMTVLRRLKEQRRSPGWKALKDVVVALVRNGDVESARAIIRNAERGEGVVTGGIGSHTKNRNLFFLTVRGLNIAMEEQAVDATIPENANMEASSTQDESSQYEGEKKAQQMTQTTKAHESDAEDAADIHEFLSNEPQPEYRQSQSL